MGEESDWELIKKCRAGEAAAWGTIITRYERLMMAIPLRYGLTHADAEDVAQTTFIDLLNGLGAFHKDSNVKGWLATVARRNSWRVMQKYDRETVGRDADLLESALALGLQAPDTAVDFDVIQWLHDGLMKLDKRCREMLIMLYFEGEKTAYEDVAERFKIAVNSVGAIRNRCLKRLRKWMGGDG